MRTFILQTAEKAAQFLEKNFHRLKSRDISFKNRYEIVTKFDYQSEEIIIEAIRKKFPFHSIWSEEAGKLKGDPDHLWLIDPLDGTTNYRIGSPIFAVSIAYAYKGELQCGIYYAPAMDEFYEAEIGKGAKLNNKKIRVSGIKEVENSINLFCHSNKESAVKKAVSYYNQIKFAGRDARQLGAASLEFGFVAVGRCESIAIPGANPYDVAPGVLLVREAGGRVTDFEGKDWTLESKDILASNGKIHQQLLDIIATLRSRRLG